MKKSRDEALALSQKWLALTAKPELTKDEAQTVITDAKENFANHVNRGWLEYRKSVTEAGQWASSSWSVPLRWRFSFIPFGIALVIVVVCSVVVAWRLLSHRQLKSAAYR